MYRSKGAGREALPPAMLCMVSLLQAYTGTSDAEAVELTVVGARWQMVLDCLGAESPLMSQDVLRKFRARLIEAGLDRRLLERTVELAKERRSSSGGNCQSTDRVRDAILCNGSADCDRARTRLHTLQTAGGQMSATLISPSDFSPFPWMRYALQEHGQRERAGKTDNNPRVLQYLNTCGSFTTDETPWCSGFANWCMRQAGILGTGRANARSWLHWGSHLSAPTYGCIAVFWREDPKSSKGHVGFFAGAEGPHILVLGGNQGNAVSLKKYAVGRLLAFRWPAGMGVPA